MMCNELKMARAKRNIGKEILDGLREIKRGELGRVTNASDKRMIPGKRKNS